VGRPRKKRPRGRPERNAEVTVPSVDLRMLSADPKQEVVMNDKQLERTHGRLVLQRFATAIVVLMASMYTGCASRNVQEFHRASLGNPWPSAPGAGRFWRSNPHSFHEKGSEEGYGAWYLVVTREDSPVVVAKAIDGARGYRYRELWIGANALKELLDIEQSGSLPSRETATMPSAATMRRPVSRFPENQASGGDSLLPSGVRASTWRTLAFCLSGWPGNSSADAVIARVDGKEFDWNTLLGELRRGTSGGEVHIGERPNKRTGRRDAH
jgi:hypothetical protein